MNCHSQDRTILNFSDYESLYGRRAMIKYVIENNLMPPWSASKKSGPFLNDISLTFKERQTLLAWLDGGLLYRDKSLKLSSRVSQGFIKNPDYVIELKKPIEVPATGFVPYKNLIFDPDFKEDKWIKEIEFVLKPKVIHHIILKVLDKKYLSKIKNPPKGLNLRRATWIQVWVSGKPYYRNLGKETGRKISKNQVFLAQLHYEPIGEKVTDFETKIKLKFHPKKPKYTWAGIQLNDWKINIPPYADNYLSQSQYTTKKDLEITRLSSHMHLRGKASSLSIVNPEGKSQEILKLSPYRYNFQYEYILKKPLFVRKGSKLICKHWFDNSKNNPINPDPSKYVKWGSYLEDEMSSCHFAYKIENK